MSIVFFIGGSLGSILLWGLILYREFRLSAAKKPKPAAQAVPTAKPSSKVGAGKARSARAFGHR